MQRLEVSSAVRPIYVSLGVKRLRRELRCSVVISYRRFGTTRQSHIQRKRIQKESQLKTSHMEFT